MKKMTFSQFKMQCQEMFSAFSEHSSMHDLRVWDSYPMDILRQRECWYCCVRLSDEVQMMITYDYDETDDKPYVCWYDYQHGTITYSHWEFSTLEEAMLFCSKEPHYNYRSYHHDNYVLCRDTQYHDGRPGRQVFVCLSILTIVDYINNQPNIPSGVWEVRKTSDFNQTGEDEIVYKLDIQNERECTIPFVACAQFKFPDYIYDI